MIFNMIGSNGPTMKSTIIISISTGSTVGAYTDAACTTLVKTATERNEGEFWITGLDNGVYYIKATKDTDESIISYTINEFGVYRINMFYRQIPEFTYTGTYEIVQDDDTAIQDADAYRGDWKIRFLTSGTLNFTNLLDAEDGIDVFLVGGGGGGGNARYDGKTSCTLGGGGGGSGETATVTNISVTKNTDYFITIGDGGTKNQDGGSSSAFGQIVDGGLKGITNSAGGAGGSGGGGGTGYANSGGAGGSEGADGNNSGYSGGVGQGSTTREFGGYSNTVDADVSAASAFVLRTEPTDTEKAFLVSGKYLTLERSGVTRKGIQNVFPIVSYDNSTRTVTLNTTYQTITASGGDTVRFGNLYAGGGGGGSSNHGYSPYNGGTGGFGGGGTGGGASSHDGSVGTANTGGGGGGGAPGYGPYNGGSGIVIIRNTR